MDNKEILNDGDIHKDSDDELIFNPYNSNNIEITDELFNVIGKKFEQRDSDFTRITKLGIRKGDSSHMVELAILDDNSVKPQEEDADE